jgi:hypothetical protein
MHLETKGRYAAAIAGTLAITVACAVTAPAPRDATVTGVWAGEHARLDVTPSGGAIEYDCAHGSLSEPLRMDGAGQFTAVGFHVREHGGPIREGEVVDSARALYRGSIVGGRLTLRVLVGVDTIGPFVLHRGAAARLWKCL